MTSLQEKLIALAITPEDLTPSNFESLPEGIAGGHMASLWDICLTFGLPRVGEPDSGLHFFAPPLQMVIEPTKLNGGVYFSIARVGDPENQRPPVFKPLSLGWVGMSIEVRWDQGINPFMIPGYISRAYRVATEMRLREGGVPVTGE